MVTLVTVLCIYFRRTNERTNSTTHARSSAYYLYTISRDGPKLQNLTNSKMPVLYFA